MIDLEALVKDSLQNAEVARSPDELFVQKISAEVAAVARRRRALVSLLTVIAIGLGVTMLVGLSMLADTWGTVAFGDPIFDLALTPIAITSIAAILLAAISGAEPESGP